MATTLPSNLYDPVLALKYAQYQWYENNSVLDKLARPDATAPIRLNLNNMTLAGGGTVLHAPVFAPISSLDTARDLTTNTDATPSGITIRDDKGVRVSRKLLASFTKSAKWLSGLRGNELQDFIVNEAMNNMRLTIRKYCIGSLLAAVQHMTSSLHTKAPWSATVRTNLSTSLLAQMTALMGDRTDVFERGKGAAWIFRSEPFYEDLKIAQLGAGVQGIADNMARGDNPHTLGLDFAIANDAALTLADAGFDHYYTLGLGAGAMELDIISMEFEPLWVNPKAENVEFVVRGDYDFELRIPGFQWDSSGGGTNPTLATASTTTNWDVTYSDAREIPIICGDHNYSGN